MRRRQGDPAISGCRPPSTAGKIARMPAQLIRAGHLYPGAPYAYAAVAPPGSLIFTAGACPIDEEGTVTDPGDFAAQARQVIANLRIALAAAGVSLTDVLKTTVYVASADRADLLSVWEVVHEAFGAHDSPSTLVGVAVLGYSGQLVEIEAIALAG
jgi:enamine deaminase RidA (YjgF/YER057c/UK114 family)